MSSKKVSFHPSATAGRSEFPDVSASRDIAGLQEATASPTQISLVIDSLKKKVDTDRCVYIMKRMEENRIKLAEFTNKYHKSSLERSNIGINDADKIVDLLTKRQKEAVDMQNGTSHCDNDSTSSRKDRHASAILRGSIITVKSAVRHINLPEVKNVPPYTTWIFLDRNRRRTKIYSVVGQRRIYYDQNGDEALIWSDSDEDDTNAKEEKKEFLDSEDYIIRMTINQLGSSDVVLDLLAQNLSRKPCELKARYEVLVCQENTVGGSEPGNDDLNMSSFSNKDLAASLDSFDKLFCRRCLVFDCKLHGLSQELIFPAKKFCNSNQMDKENLPCGMHCYRQVQKLEGNAVIYPIQLNAEQIATTLSSDGNGVTLVRKEYNSPSQPRRLISYQSESVSHKSKLVEECGSRQRNNKHIADVITEMKERRKVVTSDHDFVASRSLGPRGKGLRSNSQKENEEGGSSSLKGKSLSPRCFKRKDTSVPSGDGSLQAKRTNCLLNEITGGQFVNSSDDTWKKGQFMDANISRQEVSGFKCWKAIEKDLFKKGLEIFGRNSCLIARNLLIGMKTCAEVFQAMNSSENNESLGDGSRVDNNENMGTGLRRKSRFLRRKGRVNRPKYKWKSAGYHSIRKRISEKKPLPSRQYNPCGCQYACGKECSCLVNGTCCEKYCGCPKTCKYRFSGCQCTKSQCESHQCPCFAAGRECDPDVCSHCWISCGDGTLGVTDQKSVSNGCKNMKILLKQQQRVLLGLSDISGWGAFLKNSVPKHEYLGEYTGEVISHIEADQRGVIYDLVNCSYLFNLNDECVLDAYRKGNKLKFANHSATPNCYARILMVGGDHRVGIYAKRRISAGEELLYDYCYELHNAPAWAKKLLMAAAAAKKNNSAGPSTRRAKKLA